MTITVKVVCDGTTITVKVAEILLSYTLLTLEAISCSVVLWIFGFA